VLLYDAKHTRGGHARASHKEQYTMKSNTRKVFTLVAISIFAFTGFLVLTGCNTVEGVGEDLQGASRSTKEALD
jgi:predicted small secreted protein